MRDLIGFRKRISPDDLTVEPAIGDVALMLSALEETLRADASKT